MSVSFFGTSLRWNLTRHPSKLSPTKLQTIALTPKLLERANRTVHVPVGDQYEAVCLLPDTHDGAVTYQRLCEAIYEYYHQQLHEPELPLEYVDFVDGSTRLDAQGPYVRFGGLFAHAFPLSSQYRISLNLTA